MLQAVAEITAWELTVKAPLKDQIEGNFLISKVSPVALLQEKVTGSGRKPLAKHPMVILPSFVHSEDGISGKTEGAPGETVGEKKNKRIEWFWKM